MEEEIEKMKNAIALKHGYPNPLGKNNWEFAMMITHRTKKQIQLYEQLVQEVWINMKRTGQPAAEELHGQ